MNVHGYTVMLKSFKLRGESACGFQYYDTFCLYTLRIHQDAKNYVNTHTHTHTHTLKIQDAKNYANTHIHTHNKLFA